MAVSGLIKYLNSTIAHLALVAVITFSGAAAQAQNIPTKGCFNEGDLQPILDKDGQKPIFIGKRADAEGLLPGNLFLMNNNGYGLNIERDPRTRKLCIGSAYKNVELNHPDNSVIPSWARDIKSASTFNIQKAYEKGGRFVFRAIGFDRDQNGNEIEGKRITIMTGADKLAAVNVVNSMNEPDALFSMGSFGIYTENFNKFIGH